MSSSAVQLGAVMELHRRAVTLKAASTYIEIGVRSFGKGLFVKEPVTGSSLGSKRVFHIAPGDLVVSNVFAWEGAVAVADDRHIGMVGSHRFMTWRPIGSEVDAAYIRHYLTSERGLESLRRASPGSAGRNRTLSIKNFRAIAVPIVDIREQRNIAQHLDKLALHHQRLMETARAPGVRKALIEKWAGSGAVGHHRALSDFLTPRPGIAVERDSRYGIAGVYSFGRGLLYRDTIRGSDTKYATMTRLELGDVVYSKLGAFENAVAVVDSAGEGWYVSPEFPVFSCRNIDSRYLSYCLQAGSFAERIGKASTGIGARQKRVHPTEFLKLTIPVPDVRMQRQIADKLDLITRVSDLEETQRKLSAALLPAARNQIFGAIDRAR